MACRPGNTPFFVSEFLRLINNSSCR